MLGLVVVWDKFEILFFVVWMVGDVYFIGLWDGSSCINKIWVDLVGGGLVCLNLFILLE